MRHQGKVTFADLGIPFRLFAAPVDRASEYDGVGRCSLCGRDDQHRFQLGIGCDVVRPCPGCGTENFLDADDGLDVPCRSCAATVPFPPTSGGEEEVYACYDCLRRGAAAITQDTQFGLISWQQAVSGNTGGVPGLERADYDVVPVADDGDGEWRGVRLPAAMLWELLRTPTYLTIQGEHWQFCCHQPMVYQGEWGREDYARHAPDGDGRAFFAQVVQNYRPDLWEGWQYDQYAIYVFRCSECGRYTAHWDRF